VVDAYTGTARLKKVPPATKAMMVCFNERFVMARILLRKPLKGIWCRHVDQRGNMGVE